MPLADLDGLPLHLRWWGHRDAICICTEIVMMCCSSQREHLSIICCRMGYHSLKSVVVAASEITSHAPACKSQKPCWWCVTAVWFGHSDGATATLTLRHLSRAAVWPDHFCDLDLPFKPFHTGKAFMCNTTVMGLNP